MYLKIWLPQRLKLLFSEIFSSLHRWPFSEATLTTFKKNVVPRITLFSTFYLTVLLWWLTFSTILLVNNNKGGVETLRLLLCLYNCCVTSSTLYWRMQSCRRQIGESSPGGSLSKVGRYTRFLSTSYVVVVHNDHQIIIAFSLASIAWFAGSYFSKRPPLLLVVHTTHTLDVYVRCWCSAEWYIFCWYSFYWSSPHYMYY